MGFVQVRASPCNVVLTCVGCSLLRFFDFQQLLCLNHGLCFAMVGSGYMCTCNSNSSVVFVSTMQLGSGHVVGPTCCCG